MGIVDTYYVRCDVCGHSSEKFGSEEGMKRRLTREGWKVTALGKCKCPDCNTDE